MNRSSHTQSLGETLETMQSLFAELRQTEALAAQIQEMVQTKRYRLDALMTNFLTLAVQSEPVVETPRPVAPVENSLPLSAHGSFGAPKDLLQGRPAPSAQHVLESLNRIMGGLKDNQANAA